MDDKENKPAEGKSDELEKNTGETQEKRAELNAVLAAITGTPIRISLSPEGQRNSTNRVEVMEAAF